LLGPGLKGSIAFQVALLYVLRQRRFAFLLKKVLLGKIFRGSINDVNISKNVETFVDQRYVVYLDDQMAVVVPRNAWSEVSNTV
jgi:hypothetical protein